MPDLVGNQLIVRILLHETQVGGAQTVIQFCNFMAPVEDAALFFAVRNQVLFQLAQQSTLAAARLAADNHELGLIHRQAHIAERRLVGQRICKG